MADSSGSELLVEALEALGVEIVFGLPGVHNLDLWDALSRSGIRIVGVRHEQTAVYAADGLARVGGGLGVALTTTGPGAANTLGATGEAWASGSPVLVISTNIPTTLAREGVYRGVLHESKDQAAMFSSLVKGTFAVERVEEVPGAVAAAAALAQRAPSGPVYLEVPTDLLPARTGADPAAASEPEPSRPDPPEPGAVDRAIAVLRAAERPLVWAGGGAMRAGAGEALTRVAASLGAPVIETYMGRGLLAPDQPSWVGLPPHVPEVGGLWDEADVVLAVGTDFDGMMTQNWRMPQPERLVAINVDRADAEKNYGAEVAVIGDAREALEAIAAGLGPAPDLSPLAARMTELRAAVWSRLEREEPLAIELLRTLRAVLDPATAVFADMCIPGYWIAGFHPFAAPRRLAYPVGWGTLGFGFPASIGAALGRGERVLCVSGDGGFLFALGELATIAQEQAPVTILLVDDGGYGMLRFDQRKAGMPTAGVDLLTPGWKQLASAFGIPAREVEGVGEPLAAALAESLAAPGPSIVVVKAELTPPPNTSPRWYRS